MIGTLGAVDASRTAEFGRERDNGLPPGRAHIGLDRGERFVQRAEQLRQAALRNAFVEMGVPAVERERADARPIGLR